VIISMVLSQYNCGRTVLLDHQRLRMTRRFRA
jgi:hypothetical protein